MKLRAYYMNDWTGSETITDVTEYFIPAGELERKVDDEIMSGRVVIFQAISLSFIYLGVMKNIIDGADENKTHIIKIEAQLPESGAWRTVIFGAINLRSIETNKEDRGVSFDVLDKLAYTLMYNSDSPRIMQPNIYGAFLLDYSNGDRLKGYQHDVDPDNSKVKYLTFYAEKQDGTPIDVDFCTLSAGDVFQYWCDGENYILGLLLTEPVGVSYNGKDAFDVKVYFDFHNGVCNPATFAEADNTYRYNYYDVDTRVFDANDEIIGFDGVKLIEAILMRANTDSSIITNGLPSKTLDVSDWYNLTFKAPEDIQKTLKGLAEKCDVSLFVDKNFDYVIQKRFDYSTGATRTYDDWHAKETDFKRCAFDIVRRYICKIDGNDDVTITKVVENQWFDWGKTKTLELNYNGVTTDEATLQNYADSYAGNLLSFYGKRHLGHKTEIALLKDAYFDFDLYDHIGDYFIIGISWELDGAKITLELIEREGHIPATN